MNPWEPHQRRRSRSTLHGVSGGAGCHTAKETVVPLHHASKPQTARKKDSANLAEQACPVTIHG